MDPELKTHLENMEEHLDNKLEKMEGRLNEHVSNEIKGVLNVIKDVANNTSQIMEKLDDDITGHTERIGSLSRRVDYLEDKVLK